MGLVQGMEKKALLAISSSDQSRTVELVASFYYQSIPVRLCLNLKGKIMELEIYEAFISAGVKEDKAKAAVESINKEIDNRYKLHLNQLATKGDLAEAKTEIIKWSIGAMFAAVGMFAAIIKLFPPGVH